MSDTQGKRPLARFGGSARGAAVARVAHNAFKPPLRAPPRSAPATLVTRRAAPPHAAIDYALLCSCCFGAAPLAPEAEGQQGPLGYLAQAAFPKVAQVRAAGGARRRPVRATPGGPAGARRAPR